MTTPYRIPPYNPYPGVSADAPSISYGTLNPMIDYSHPDLLSVAPGGFYIQQVYFSSGICQAIAEARWWYKRCQSIDASCAKFGDPGDWVAWDGAVIDGVGVARGSLSPWCEQPARTFYVQRDTSGNVLDLWVKIAPTGPGGCGQACLDTDWVSMGVSHLPATLTFLAGQLHSWNVSAQTGNVPPVTITYGQHTNAARISVDSTRNIINVAGNPMAHRRRSFVTHGSVVVSPGAWQPVLDNFTDVVMDNTGLMCPATPDYGIVIPMAGWWWLEARSVYGNTLPPTAGVTMGVGIYVDGVLQQGGFFPAASGASTYAFTHIEYRYSAGSVVSLAAWSENATPVTSGSFDLVAIWLGA